MRGGQDRAAARHGEEVRTPHKLISPFCGTNLSTFGVTIIKTKGSDYLWRGRPRCSTPWRRGATPATETRDLELETRNPKPKPEIESRNQTPKLATRNPKLKPKTASGQRLAHEQTALRHTVEKRCEPLAQGSRTWFGLFM